jgi:hypothetical protein
MTVYSSPTVHWTLTAESQGLDAGFLSLYAYGCLSHLVVDYDAKGLL